MANTVLQINHILGDAERDVLINSIEDRSWLAVLQVVLAQMEIESQGVSDPKSAENPGIMANSAGRLSSLRDLIASLQMARQTGAKVKIDEELE